MRLLSCLATVGLGFGAWVIVWAQNGNQLPDSRGNIVRLRPAAFPQLPADVARELNRRGCRIPQNAYEKKPHNVITGEFARGGQTDWAVLCSVRGVSSILVFWNGKADKPAAVAPLRDDWFVQSMGGGQWGFSRGISAVGKDYILAHNSNIGVPLTRRIDHQGINDAFIEKASSIHYYYGRKWLELPGAD